MAALTGNSIASTYKDLLQVSNSNSGVDSTVRVVSDGEGTSSALYLSTSKVGIGTAGEALLHVYSAATSQKHTPDELLRLEQKDEGVDMSAGHGPAITFYVGETDGSDHGGTIAVVREAEGDADSAAAMSFYTAGDDTAPTEKMRITSTGNVGINVTDPDEVLEVAGDVKISGANKLYFYDSGGEYISSNGAILSIVGGDEIDLTATAVDLNGTLNVSGLATVQTGIVPDAQDGAYLGTTSLQWSDLFLADSAVIGFGDDNDTTITHTDGTGLTLNSTNKLCFNDSSQFVQGSSATVLSI